MTTIKWRSTLPDFYDGDIDGETVAVVFKTANTDETGWKYRLTPIERHVASHAFDTPEEACDAADEAVRYSRDLRSAVSA